MFSLPAIILLRLIVKLLSLFRKLPYANFIFGRPEPRQIALYCILLPGFLYLSGRWRTKKRRFLLFPLIIPMVFVLAIHARSGLTLHFLDIGQGDCCVMEMPGGRNVMVDGGSSTVYDVGANRIMPFLKYEGIRQLDYVFVTHMDSDHISGVVELIEAVRDGETALRVGRLVLPFLKERGDVYHEMEAIAEDAGIPILYVEEGDMFVFEDKEDSSAKREGEKAAEVRFRILGPEPSVETSPVDENGQCITFALKYGDFDCLMTGDVQNAGEDNMIRILREAGYRAEVLKVAHHGSKYSTPQELLDFLRPDVSVISCGKDNWYGHPHAALLRRLMEADTEIMRTDESGAVSVVTDGVSYRWEAYGERG